MVMVFRWPGSMPMTASDNPSMTSSPPAVNSRGSPPSEVLKTVPFSQPTGVMNPHHIPGMNFVRHGISPRPARTG
jgi:hypothetical protein